MESAAGPVNNNNNIKTEWMEASRFYRESVRHPKTLRLRWKRRKKKKNRVTLVVDVVSFPRAQPPQYRHTRHVLGFFKRGPSLRRHPWCKINSLKGGGGLALRPHNRAHTHTHLVAATRSHPTAARLSLSLGGGGGGGGNCLLCHPFFSSSSLLFCQQKKKITVPS